MLNDEFEPASAYSWLLQLCQRRMLEPAELGAYLGNVSRQKSIFHLSPRYSSKLAIAVGAGHPCWSYSLGTDLLGELASRTVFVSHLRYCPRCLECGWHSILFQHAAVQYCPEHRIPLCAGCPHCGAPSGASPDEILANHLYCESCGERASRAEVLITAPATWRRSFSRLHQILQAGADRSLERSRYISAHCADAIVTSANGTRAMAAHLSGELLSCAAIRLISEVRLPIRNANAPSEALRAEALADRTWKCLRKLKSMLDTAHCEELPRRVFLTLGTTAARQSLGRTSLLRIALWRTAIGLGLRMAMWNQRPKPSRAGHAFNNLLPQCLSAACIVAEAQVYSLFAWNLMELRRLNHSNEVAWMEMPAPAVFSPAWRLVTEDGRRLLVLRQRVGIDNVDRLIQRYRNTYTCA